MTMGEDSGKTAAMRLVGESGEPIEHMHRVIGAALLAVIDDIDAAFDLPAHHMRDCLAHGGVQLALMRAWFRLLGEQ